MIDTQLWSRRILATFVPIIVSYLRFSLRKAAAEQAEPWDLSAVGDSDMGGLPEVESLRFAYWFDASYETLGALALPNGEVIELGSRLPWDHG